MIAVSLYCLS